ncbi:hypothetical protein B0T19DRAFT_395448 [Cercophora scortea]|uniref:Cyanovirin-N domain-containing protein n=1 Tax=Cercophora scortea TaxID=314031 RepID=A0AAE0J2Q3_9PEZI|nr:hypothetical protein B0T19DRAFT_395448 [Cercophora scortea]
MVLAALVPSATAGFLASCQLCVPEFDFGGHTLVADCTANDPGNSVVSSLDLNYCIGNDNGILKAMDSGFFADSCNACYSTPTADGDNKAYMHCICNDQDQNPVDTHDIVDNFDGRLGCFGGKWLGDDGACDDWYLPWYLVGIP